jgi:hypothetical protein
MKIAAITLLTSLAVTSIVGIRQIQGANITTITFEGQTAPDGNGAILNFSQPTLANDGSIAWISRLTGTSGSFDDTGILHYSCHGLSFAVHENDPSPTAAGVPDQNGSIDDLRFVQLQLGPDGDLVVAVDLRQTIGGSLDDSGLFIYDGDKLRRVARENDVSPSGNARFDQFNQNIHNSSQLSVGRDGSVLFYQELRDLNNNRFFESAIHRWDDGVLSDTARKGTPPETDPTSDFDADGNVDYEDLHAWEENFGTPCVTTHWQGDASGDNDTDGGDFLNWQKNFGAEVSGNGSVGSFQVPEPRALWLTMSILWTLLIQRRSQSQ